MKPKKVGKEPLRVILGGCVVALAWVVVVGLATAAISIGFYWIFWPVVLVLAGEALWRRPRRSSTR